MDIRGPTLDRFEEDQVHELRHGSFFSRPQQVIGARRGGIGGPLARLVKVTQKVLGGVTTPIVTPFDALNDYLARRHHRP